VTLVGFAPALLFVLLAGLDPESSAAARDAAVIALGVCAVAVTLTYLIGLVALALTAALGVRLESLSGEVSVLAGAAVGALTGAGTSPVIGTGLLIGSLFGATLGFVAALVYAWLRIRVGASSPAS
jgi:hypothetical protein